MSEEKKTAELRDEQLEQATGGMSTQGDIIIPDLASEIVTGKSGQSFYLENGNVP